MTSVADTDIINTMEEKYLSPREFGERLDPPRSSQRICKLCQDGRIPGAIQQSVLNRKFWLVPESALKNFNEKVVKKPWELKTAEEVADELGFEIWQGEETDSTLDKIFDPKDYDMPDQKEEMSNKDH